MAVRTPGGVRNAKFSCATSEERGLVSRHCVKLGAGSPTGEKQQRRLLRFVSERLRREHGDVDRAARANGGKGRKSLPRIAAVTKSLCDAASLWIQY